MNMNELMVTIIIPIYNAEPHIRDTLKTVQAQTYRNWECICVDDGSTDNSYEAASEFSIPDPRFRLYRRPSHLPKGGNSCRNYGFELAKGDLIQWFDADDLMRPFMIERKAAILGAYPRLDFAISKVGELEDGQVNYKEYQADSANRVRDFLAYRIHFLTPGPLFRRSFLLGRQLFSIKLKRHQEWEFYSRLLINGCEYRVINKYCSLRKIHPKSINSVYQKKTGLDRSYIKLFTVDELNKNTRDKAVLLLFRIFHRYMIWAIFHSLIQFRLKYLLFLSRLFLEFSIKSFRRYLKLKLGDGDVLIHHARTGRQPSGVDSEINTE